jgi:DNA-binding transcriptional regulator GbsR (MarR family)
MHLKPQDTLLALKYGSLKQSNSNNTIVDIAESIGISVGEMSKGTRSLSDLGLITARWLVEHNASFYRVECSTRVN